MKLSIDLNERPFCVIEHDSQKLEFDLRHYGRKPLENNDIPHLINEYWATLPGFQQQKIFDVYSKAYDIFMRVTDTSALIVNMIPIVRALYDELDLKRMHEWVGLRTDVLVPSRFESEYKQTDDKPFTRDRTYTYSDYMALVTLALALRPMLPIWGQFIFITQKESGNDYKEYNAFQLLSGTPLMETSAMQKLRLYILGNVQDDRLINVIVSGKVSKEDYPQWLLANVIVRRVCVGNLRGVEHDANLVVTIHNDLMQKNNPTSGQGFGDPIRKKVFEGDDKNEHGISRLENYKIKATHPQGDIEAIKHYMRDPYAVGKRLMEDLNPGVLVQFLEHIKALQTERLWPCQIGLTQWVMAPVIPPRGIYHLDKVTTIRAMAVAQTFLWQHGHKQLAALLTAINSDNSMSFQQTGIASMARIPDAYKEELDRLIPYNQQSVKRKQTSVQGKAELAISQLANDFNAREWILTLPDQMVGEITGSNTHRRYSCPHDIKPLLARLAIQCASRIPVKPKVLLDDIAPLVTPNTFPSAPGVNAPSASF